MAEGGRLENGCSGNTGTVGSNPTLSSAKTFIEVSTMPAGTAMRFKQILNFIASNQPPQSMQKWVQRIGLE